jgi:hypothetical protein
MMMRRAQTSGVAAIDCAARCLVEERRTERGEGFFLATWWFSMRAKCEDGEAEQLLRAIAMEGALRKEKIRR